uniref:Uncharacterized protein TCIL3000_9_3410 n=1 Tax=Trypanosoma congolense (strain IL3000) TaxID=1068625 RepID=G0UU80_TRYCI|nr:unnamed protein product [Trypanosoma congolense IL3000]
MVATTLQNDVTPFAFNRRIGRYHNNPYAAYVLECSEEPPRSAPAATTPPQALSVSVAAASTNEEDEEHGSPSLCSPDAMVHIGLVEFKYGVQEFYLPFAIQVGEMVVTEGDRGEDLGLVRLVTSLSSLPSHVGMRVLRIATPRDVEQHRVNSERETEALRKMRSLAQQVKCPAYIKDVMYQLDGRKITCIIVRNVRTFIDFRRLQRVAFDVFRCRLWFAYLDEIPMPRGVATGPSLLHCNTRCRGSRAGRTRV